MVKSELSAWPERRPERNEITRSEIVIKHSSHLPPLVPFYVSNEDIDAMKAAFIHRFDEQLPRTETLFAVAAIGYRLALRDLAQTKEIKT